MLYKVIKKRAMNREDYLCPHSEAMQYSNLSKAEFVDSVRSDFRQSFFSCIFSSALFLLGAILNMIDTTSQYSQYEFLILAAGVVFFVLFIYDAILFARYVM